MTTFTTTCAACRGTGRCTHFGIASHDVPCSSCGGSGRIIERRNAPRAGEEADAIREQGGCA